MAKTTAPTLSFGASGQIAKTMVYSTWRGVKYVRRHVIPANPRTESQMAVRNLFAFLREIFKLAGLGLSAPWDAFALGRPFTGMNKFVGENVRVLNGDVDLTDVIISPGAKGGLPPTGIVVTSPTPTEAHVAITWPVLPSGWNKVGAAAIALLQQDPTGIFTGGVSEGAAVGPGFDTLDVTGLETGDDYVVGVYLIQSKPDGSLAYSVSLSDEVTIT
jgi:hypothetical protein